MESGLAEDDPSVADSFRDNSEPQDMSGYQDESQPQDASQPGTNNSNSNGTGNSSSQPSYHHDLSSQANQSTSLNPFSSNKLTGGNEGDNANPGRNSFSNRLNSTARAEHGNGAATGLGAHPSGTTSLTNRDPWHYLAEGNKHGRNEAKNYLQAKVKKRIIGWILGGAGAGLGGLSIISGPGLYLNKIRDVLEQKFNYAAASMQQHANALLQCKMTSGCLKSSKMGKMTPEEINDLKAHNVEPVDANGDPVDATTGGSDVAALELNDVPAKNGKPTKIMPSDLNDLPRNNPGAANIVQSAANTDGAYDATAGEGAANAFAKDDISKSSPLEDDVGDETDPKTGNVTNVPPDEQAGKTNIKDPIEKNVTTYVNTGATDAPPGKPEIKSEEQGLQDDIKTESADISDNIDANLDAAPKTLTAKMLSNLSTAGVANAVCYPYLALYYANLGAEVVKDIALARFAMIILNTADAIRAGTATPEQVSQVAGILTTVLIAPKNNYSYKYPMSGQVASFAKGAVVLGAATDSFGYKYANNQYTTKSGSQDTSDLTLADAVTPDTWYYAIAGMGGFFGSMLNNPALKATVIAVIDGINGYAAYLATTSAAEAAASMGSDIAADVSTFTSGSVGALITANTFSANTALNFAIAKSCSWLVGAKGQVALGTLDASALLDVGAGEAGDGGIAALSKVFQGGIKDFLKTMIAKVFSKQGLKDLAIGALKSTPQLLLSLGTGMASSWLTKYATGKFMSTLPLGAEAGDAMTSGSDAIFGSIAQMSGNAALDEVEALAYTQQMTQYNLEQAAVSRAGDSPFNIMNNNTFLGSIAGNFAASIYNNGSDPLAMASSLIGMFGNSLNTLVNSTPAMAGAATIQNLNTCQGSDPQAAGYAVDPFCNVIYGLPDGSSGGGTTGSNTAYAATATPNYFMDPQTTENQMTSGNYIDSSGNPQGDFATFMTNCVNRVIPLGATSDSQTDDGSGCALSKGNNKLFYNYVQYTQANDDMAAGGMLGSVADGSAAAGGQ